MQPIILRADQQYIKECIYSDWNVSIKNVLAVKPTGSGKSIVISDIVLDGYLLGMRQAVIAHRNELVSQMSVHLARRGIPHRIISSKKTVKKITNKHRKLFGQSFVNPSAETAVIGVDTLVARKDELKEWCSQVDRWVIDEAHHVIGGVKIDQDGSPLKDKDGNPVWNTDANKWGKAVHMFPNAQGLGVTATPLRADGKGLGRDYDGVFDTMHVGLEMRALIEMGALSDYEIVCPTSDLTQFIEQEKVSKDGDWSVATRKKAAKKSRIVGDAVKAYCQYSYMKQAIVFATDVETAGDIASKFQAVGIRAAAVSAKTDQTVRDKYVEDFEAGKLQILINVDLFDEGFDVPACEVVIMARPTASFGKYKQMVGRGLRASQGKTYGLIIDLVSNVVRHGLPDKVVQWTLARRDKRGAQMKDPNDIDLTVCKSCTKPYEPFNRYCPYCGRYPPLPEPRERSIEMVDGDLSLLDRAKLEEMRKATAIESPGSVGNRVRYAVGAAAGKRHMDLQLLKIAQHDRLKEAIAQWAAVERTKGFEDYQIEKKFYLTTGVDVLTALDGSKSRQDFETLADRVEGWYL